LRRLTGAEAALVVNNNAGAVLLALAALAEGREVLVSRGELIEIGDGFRIPDVLARSGARLREVGTTNRTRAADYERAVGPETALLLRVHQSNFRVVGFTEQPRLEELVRIGRARGIPVVDDLGSGVLVELEGEPSARDALRAGADLVCFSGDKLLGGPQAGIVVGRADLVEKLRRHPLQRALRADKLTLAALEATLALYLDPQRAACEIPVLRMLGQPLEAVRARAERLAELVGGEVEQTVGRVGGGALPLAELPSFACAVEEELAAPLREGEPTVIGILRDGRLLLDCRTLTDEEVDEVAAAIAAVRSWPRSRPRSGSGISCAEPSRRGHSGSRPTWAWPGRSRAGRVRWPSSPVLPASTPMRSAACCARSRATASSPRRSPVSSAIPKPLSSSRPAAGASSRRCSAASGIAQSASSTRAAALPSPSSSAWTSGRGWLSTPARESSSTSRWRRVRTRASNVSPSSAGAATR